MNGIDMPIIRFEVERMRHSIMACIGPALEAEQKQLEELVDQAVRSFDFKGEVKRQVYQQLSEQIHEATKRAVQRGTLNYSLRYLF